MQRSTTSICPLGKMTVTLDDVACLLDIPIIGRRGCDYERGMRLLQCELGMIEEEVIDEVNK